MAAAGPIAILVVDDDEVDRMAVRRALKTAGMSIEVEEARTVSGAVERLGEERFDAAIIDYNLPDGDGSGVLDAARDALEPVPCIVLTGQGDEGLAVDLMKEGARDYIPKASLSPDRLAQSLRTVVQVSRAEREARRARRGQEFLIAVSAELAGSLDYRATAERVVRLAIPELGDLSVLLVADEEGTVRRVAVGHRDPEVRESLQVDDVFRHADESDSMLSRVLTNGEPVFEPDVDASFLEAYAEDPTHAEYLRRFRPSSIVALPLRARDRTLGALVLAFTDGRSHSAHDYAVAQNLASRAALALDNARLYRDVQEEMRMVERLHRFGNTVTSHLELETVLQEATDAATELVGAELGAFFYNQVADDGHDDLLYTVSGAPSDAVERLGLSGTAPMVTRTFQGKGVVRIADVCEDPDYRAPDPESPHDGPALRSYLSVPVALPDGEVVGGLFFGHGGRGVFSERDERIAAGAARWTAVAVQNARLYAESRRSTRARDEMLAVVSHDLRNPLNVIATSASLILEIPLPEEKKKAQLEVIRRTTERMNRLIQDLLDVTGIEAGKLSVSPQLHDVDDILEEACESMANVAKEAAVELRCSSLGETHHVSADRERILQVFGNLIANALRFTPDGGSITVGARPEDDVVAFFVADTGPGIPEDDLPHLFDRFWKGRNSTGTGLGLPIAKGIVEVHGGTLSVETEEGRGTTFTFTLPLADAAAGKATAGD
ncbi:MAG: GAF domain-containing protein [Gemmatimonadetes bacterium]|nr:GAF domain-containing protein [Gemmatimonadota bacterium]